MRKIAPEKRKFVTLIVTENCNLSCSYCYEHDKTRKTMSLDLAKKIIDDEMTKKDYSELVCFDFFGGEPFLEFEKIKELTDYIKKRNFKKSYDIFVGTNGTLVHGEIQKWLIENKDYVNCGLSLDGNKFMHDINRSNSFDKIDLKFFKDNYPNIIIKMTVSKETLPYISDGVIFLHEFGFKKITCNLAYGIDWSDAKNETILNEQLKILIDYYLSHPNLQPCSMLDYPIENISNLNKETTVKFCGAGTHMHTYDVRGDCYPCHFFTPFSAGEKSKEAKKIKFCEVFPKKMLDVKCQNCLAVDICPTCYGSNFLSSGNIFSKTDDYCALTKTMIRASSYLKAMMWERGLLNINKNREYQLLKSIALIQKDL